MKNIILSLIMLLGAVSGAAQDTSNFVGQVYSATDSACVDDAYVSLVLDGQVKYGAPMDCGCAFIGGVVNGKYTVEVDAFGYELYRDTVTISAFKVLDVYLKPQKAIALKEISVEGSRSDVVTRTAYGHVFYLSEKARKLKNPFYALMEVPALEVNPSTSSVKTLNGKTPLILVNGNRVNTGINPIDPAEIESVELITDPPARYINEGVTAILNIKVRKKESPYVWYELSTRHELPLYYGFGVGYFEIGNPKYSLYGRTSLDYQYNQDFAKSVYREFSDYTQHYNSTSRGNSRGWLGELLLKANPSEKDYFAVQGYTKSTLSKVRGSGLGLIDDVPYDFDSKSRTRSVIATASAYYKHAFSDKKEFEARLAYNYNKNNFDNDRTDTYSTEEDGSFDDMYMQQMRNMRHSGQLQLDFNHIYSYYGSYGFGAHTSMTFDRLHQITDPASLYRNRNISQYVYAQWGTKLWKKLWVTPSVGLNAMWLKQGDFSKNYFLPRIIMDLVWQPNDAHSVSLKYQLTNDAASIRQLNPINTSADPLYKVIGNPRLKPQTMHYVPLVYSFTKKKWFIQAQVYYKRINNMLSAESYVDDNGVLVSTYGNAEHFSQVLASASANYRIKNGRFTLTAGWYANYFKDQTHGKHNMFFINPSFNLTVKKFLFLLNLYYQTADIQKISYDKFFKPWGANFQINYNITDNFYIGLCMQNFTGTYRTRTITSTDAFYEVMDTKNKYMSPRPFIILRYSFRKNAKRKIRLEKVLNSTEEGIKL